MFSYLEMIASRFKMFFLLNLIPFIVFLLIGATESQSVCGISSTQNCSGVSLKTTTIICYYGDSSTTYPLDAAGAKAMASDSNFSKNKQTVIVIPGFTRTPNSPGPFAIKEAFRQKNASVNNCVVNVTDIFAGTFNSIPSYVSVSPNSVCLGRGVGEFIISLNQNGVSENTIHLIGHSLGGPAASFACKYFSGITGTKILRFTVLDSAGPCFYPDTSIQPQKTDAQHVDAIHTNQYGYGTATKLGHADFYPNGGSYQPNCNVESNIGNITCSHADALFYFAESINSFLCIGFKYATFLVITYVDKTKTALMGYNWSYQTGDYYLSTNSAPTFCRGTAGYQ